MVLGGRLNLRELGVPQQGVGTRPKGSKGRPVRGLPVQGPGEISGLLDCPALPSPRVSSSGPPRAVGGDHPLRSPTRPPRPAVPTCSRRFCQRPHGLSSRMSLSSSLSSSRSRSRPRLGAGSGAAMDQPAQAAALRGIRGPPPPPPLPACPGSAPRRPGGSGAAGRRLEPPRCSRNWETRRAAGAGRNPPAPPAPQFRAEALKEIPN